MKDEFHYHIIKILSSGRKIIVYLKQSNTAQDKALQPLRKSET